MVTYILGRILAVVPVLFAVSQFYTQKLKLRWRDLKNLESSSMGVIQEVLSSVRVVKAFAQEDREQSRYMTHAGKSLRQQLKLSFTGGTFSFPPQPSSAGRIGNG